jgi:hypothetical protein
MKGMAETRYLDQMRVDHLATEMIGMKEVTVTDLYLSSREWMIESAAKAALAVMIQDQMITTKDMIKADLALPVTTIHVPEIT